MELRHAARQLLEWMNEENSLQVIGEWVIACAMFSSLHSFVLLLSSFISILFGSNSNKLIDLFDCEEGRKELWNEENGTNSAITENEWLIEMSAS